MRVRKCAAALAALMLLMATGCMSGKALDKFSYVTSVGIDEGETKKYAITLQIQRESQTESTLEGAGANLITIDADTIFEAVDIADASFPNLLDFSRVNSFVLSSEAASGDFYKDFIGSSLDALHIRQSARIMSVMGRVADYYKGQDMSTNPNIAKQQSNILEDYATDGNMSMTNAALFMEGVESGRFDPVVPLARIDKTAAPLAEGDKIEAGGNEPSGSGGGSGGDSGGNGGGEKKDEYVTDGRIRHGGMATYILGSAVFDGARMAGTIDALDTEILNMMRGEDVAVKITYRDGDNVVVLRLAHSSEPNVKMTLQPTPEARMLVCLSGNIEFDTAGDAEKKWGEGLKDEIETYVEEQMKSVFTKLRSLNSDAVGFGRYASKKFCDTKEWESYDWKKEYKKLEAGFEVRINVGDIASRGE